MENINWVLIIKIVGYWFAWFGIVYLLARIGFKKSSYNWGAYQDFTMLGTLFFIMRWISINIPIAAIVGYLTYLLFKS